MIVSGRSTGGKTLALAQHVVENSRIPDDALVSDGLADWAEYFYGNRPVTKADLREVLRGGPE